MADDEYGSARLFAQQNRVTRLLYTLRDMNEFGLVVDFNRLQLVREAGGALLLRLRLLPETLNWDAPRT